MIEFLKLSPVFLLAGMMMLTGFGFWDLDILVIAPIATVYGAIIAAVTDKFSFNELVDTAIDNVKEMQLVFFILMLAYALAEAFMATGVGAAIINVALKFGMTGRTVAVTGLLVSSILSMATGSSWGTFAAAAPIFLWLNHMVNGDVVLTTAAVIGGSCFGDNIGLISDNTIVSSNIHDVRMEDRLPNQGIWSIIILVASAIIFYLVGMKLPNESGSAATAISQIPEEVWASLNEQRPAAVELLNQVQTGVPVYMVIPLLVVIGTAMMAMPTLACLGLGLITSCLLGVVAGTTTFMEFLNLMYSGFEGAGSWVIIMMMWVGAFGGIMSKMDAFKPLSNFVVKIAKNSRQLMFCNGLLSIIGNAALADEMAQLVTIGPIMKTITEENIVASEEDMYQLRLRNASFSSALGVFGSQFIPWHVYPAFFIGIAGSIYPLHEFQVFELMRHNYLAMLAVASILIMTLTGLDRLIPNFGLPKEPDVQLKKNLERQ